MIDASAAVLGLANDGAARRSLTSGPVAVPYLADSEVAHAFRSQVLRGSIDELAARIALDRWVRLSLRRFSAVGLLDRIWALRENVTAYDATYVALAETLGCELVTADGRLAASPGPKCPITVIRT